jgi:hypothetical protein
MRGVADPVGLRDSLVEHSHRHSSGYRFGSPGPRPGTLVMLQQRARIERDRVGMPRALPITSLVVYVLKLTAENRSAPRSETL